METASGSVALDVAEIYNVGVWCARGKDVRVGIV